MSRTGDNLLVYLEFGYVKLKVIVHSYIIICQNLIKSTGPKPSHIVSQPMTKSRVARRGVSSISNLMSRTLA